MTLNQNSLTARFYKWLYQKSELPNSLCPYFWLLLISPIVLPSRIILIPFKKWIPETTSDNSEPTRLQTLFGITLLLLGLGEIIYCNYHFIRYLFNAYSYDRFIAFIGGFLDSCILILILFICIVVKLEDGREYILIEFVKAKYGRYCPKINWN